MEVKLYEYVDYHWPEDYYHILLVDGEPMESIAELLIKIGVKFESITSSQAMDLELEWKDKKNGD